MRACIALYKKCIFTKTIRNDFDIDMNYFTQRNDFDIINLLSGKTQHKPNYLALYKELAMKNHHLISALQTGYKTASVRFIQKRSVTMLQNAVSNMPHEQTLDKYLQQIVNSNDRQHTYKVGFAVKPGDVCVVDTASGLSLVYVVEVHSEPQIDTDVEYEYRWLIASVDFSNYLDTVKKESQLKREISKLRARRQIENIRTQLIGETGVTDDLQKALDANTYNVEE